MNKLTPKQYLNNLPEDRRADMKALDKLIQKATGLKPFIMGKMIGYGPYHYKYASGREGNTAAVALASQKNYISMYACMANDKGYVAEQYKAKLPQASIGKSCVRFKRLVGNDPKMITALLKENLKAYKAQLKKQNESK